MHFFLYTVTLVANLSKILVITSRDHSLGTQQSSVVPWFIPGPPRAVYDLVPLEISG